MKTKQFAARCLVAGFCVAGIGVVGWFWYIVPVPFDSVLAFALGCACMWAVTRA